jgi:hypothetical protein
MRLRTIGSGALYLACTARATAPAPPPAADGARRVAGSSGALLASTDGGSFGDRTELRGDVSGGPFVSDTAPLLQGRIGMETFLTETVALDFGLRVPYVDSLELGNFDEDVTSV